MEYYRINNTCVCVCVCVHTILQMVVTVCYVVFDFFCGGEVICDCEFWFKLCV
jgi:hypothetical protein